MELYHGLIYNVSRSTINKPKTFSELDVIGQYICTAFFIHKKFNRYATDVFRCNVNCEKVWDISYFFNNGILSGMAGNEESTE